MNKPQEIKYEIHAHEGCEKCLRVPAFARKIPLQELPVVKCRHNKEWLWPMDEESIASVKDDPSLFECSCLEPITYAD